MDLSISPVSAPFSQALKKSACMVDPGGSPWWSEESLTVPEVVGMGNRTFMARAGTGFGWVLGHCFVPSSCITA